MPTTTEVEARLRRTATACDPLVEDLMDGPPAAVARRPRRAGWLAAAALAAAAVALAGVAVTTTGDDPSDDVTSAAPDTLFDRSTTTDPAAANPRLSTSVTLPDGTEVTLGIPGPERWTARYGEVAIAVDGGDPMEISLTELGGAASAPIVEEDLGDGAAIVRWGESRLLAIERDGWVATAPLTSDRGDLPGALVPRLARDLTFAVGPAGPVDVGGPGITVREARTQLVRDGDPSGRESALTVAHAADGGRHPLCAGDQPPVPTRTQRCLADGRLLLSARGTPTQVVLPGVVAAIGDAEPAAGPQVPVSLADGTQVVLTVPGDDPWAVTEATVEVELDDIEGVVGADLAPGSAAETAARAGWTITSVGEGRGEGTSVASAADGMRWLLAESGGWTVRLPLDTPDQVVSDTLRERLVRTIAFEATAAGPADLRADGLEVVGAVTILAATAAPAPEGDRDTLVVRSGNEGCPAMRADRCLADGRLGIGATGPTARAVLDGITAEVSPR